MWFTRIKGFFNKGYWSKEMVSEAVRLTRITASEYQLITGEDYPAHIDE